MNSENKLIFLIEFDLYFHTFSNGENQEKEALSYWIGKISLIKPSLGALIWSRNHGDESLHVSSKISTMQTHSASNTAHLNVENIWS